jgi:hypothetical protein
MQMVKKPQLKLLYGGGNFKLEYYQKIHKRNAKLFWQGIKISVAKWPTRWRDGSLDSGPVMVPDGGLVNWQQTTFSPEGIPP